MLLVNAPMGYTVCLECHEIDRGCSPEWAENHTHDDDERRRSMSRHPARSVIEAPARS